MEGIARGVAWRTETRTSASGQGQRSTTVLNFRLDRFDEDGRQLPGLAVEMRGSKFNGVIADGDRIELPAGWQPGRLQTPRRLRNLTSGTVVQASHGRLRSIVGASLAIAVFVIIGYFVVGWMGQQMPDLGVPDVPGPEGWGDWDGWDDWDAGWNIGDGP